MKNIILISLLALSILWIIEPLFTLKKRNDEEKFEIEKQEKAEIEFEEVFLLKKGIYINGYLRNDLNCYMLNCYNETWPITPELGDEYQIEVVSNDCKIIKGYKGRVIVIPRVKEPKINIC